MNSSNSKVNALRGAMTKGRKAAKKQLTAGGCNTSAEQAAFDAIREQCGNDHVARDLARHCFLDVKLGR